MKISINGGQVVPLLPNSRTSDKALGISPDGKKLAYLSYVFDSKSSGEKRAAIFVRSLNGDEVGEIVNTLGVDWFDWAYERVNWTPDGRALTFEYEKNVKSKKRYDLRKLDIETGNEISLTSFEYEAGQLAAFKWSNDGKKLFIMRWIGQPVEVVLVRNRDVSKKLY
jgi:Tol biopolymer transport system component